MSNPNTEPFQLTADVRTLVFTKGDRETREPQRISVTNKNDIFLVVTVEWYRKLKDTTFEIASRHQIEARDSEACDLTGHAFRDGDLLYVTATQDADVFVHTEEPD